jgi:hypothetical protein
VSGVEITFGDGSANAHVDCPHIKNGVCDECIRPLVTEVVRGRAAVEALEAIDKVMVAQMADLARLRKWLKERLEQRWEYGPEDPAPGSGSEG